MQYTYNKVQTILSRNLYVGSAVILKNLYLLEVVFPHVEFQETYLDDLIRTADESVQDAVYVRRIRLRMVGTLEGSLVLPERRGENEAMAT